MEDLFPVLQEIYNGLCKGTQIIKDSHALANFLCPCLSTQSPSMMVNVSHLQSGQFYASSAYGSNDPWGAGTSNTVIPVATPASGCIGRNACRKDNQHESLLLQMTLIEMVAINAHSWEEELGVRDKYADSIRILLDEMSIVPKLLCLFGDPNKLLSHVAIKCTSSVVFFQIKRDNNLNDAWLKACLQTLSEHPKSGQTADCLRSLTAVIKAILKDKTFKKTEVLKNLFTNLDTVFENLYNHMFPQCSKDSKQIMSNTKSQFETVNNLISFIDLLEVLVACRTQLSLHYLCQRLLFLQASQPLEFMTSLGDYMIKKKLILLLKKCVLHKAGEDFISGSLHAVSQQLPCLNEDVLVLANAIFHAVMSGWLQQVPVSPKGSLFGGSELLSEDITRRPDLTMLRAISLMVIKALEIKILNLAAGDDPRAELLGFMPQLMTFVGKHLKSPQEFLHPCTWVSLVFLEHDEDMLEAAKALLTIYVHFDSFCRFKTKSDHKNEMWSHVTHRQGYNPHCIFLLLLKNILFDHRVLLDFLISTETCFLEYFVRYLKFLREDWDQFCSTCQLFDAVAPTHDGSTLDHLNMCERGLASSPAILTCGSEVRPTEKLFFTSSRSTSGPMKEQSDNQSVNPCKSEFLISSGRESSLTALQSLAEYGSSDDSGSEAVEPECLANTKQTRTAYQGSTEIREIREAVCIDGDKVPGTVNMEQFRAGQAASNYSSFSRREKKQNGSRSCEDMFPKSVVCLTELQKAIDRLQRRKLFPYNPSALLKLLLQIKTISSVTA
uniref:Lines homolog 1 n=1 Tax=Latimeria chalumnae TaxID=7897 RepID=H3BE46_LATCH